MAVETKITRGQWFIGSDFEIWFNVVQEDLVTPQNMTGWSLLFIIKQRTTTGVTKLTKSTGTGIQITNGAGTNSRAKVTVTRSDTLSWEEGDYYYALWRTDDPNDSPLAYGSVFLTKVAMQP